MSVENNVIDLMAALRDSLARSEQEDAEAAARAAIIEPPPPGIYPDVPMLDYQAWNACSSSRVRQLDRSAAHLRAYLLDPPKTTPALVLGAALHTAILEPDEMPKRYVVAGQCEATTKKGERCSKTGTVRRDGHWFCSTPTHDPTPDEPFGMTILSADDYDACFQVRDSAFRHPRLKLLLEAAGAVELSAVWRQQFGDTWDDAVIAKARFDCTVPRWSTLLDCKSTPDARRDSFEKSIFNFGYHRQAALYLDAAEQLMPGEFEHFVIVAIEKGAPWVVQPYRLTDDAVKAGRDELRLLLPRYKAAFDNDEWPAYSDRIEDVSLPEWAYRRIYGG